MINENKNERTSASQKKQIKLWLENGNKITSLEALELFGCMRLASRIHELRESGMVIKKRTICTPSKKYVTQYYL